MYADRITDSMQKAIDETMRRREVQDAPMREPYTAYLQGGLTYESGKAGVLLAVEELLRGE